MSEQIDANVGNLGESDDVIIEEVKKAVDANLPSEKKGKWSADVQRDVYGKVIRVCVNLPDSVTENEKANAVNAIGRNRGVASVGCYPLTLIDQDMESLAVGTKILPEFYVESGDAIVEGVTEDEAKSGVKSFSGTIPDYTPPFESIEHAYDLPCPTLKNLLVELQVKSPSGVETGGGFNIGSSQVPIYASIEKFKGGWIEKAGRLGAEIYILSMTVFNNKIYGGTGNSGKLVEWNGVDAWVEKASQLGAEQYIYSLVVFNNKIYGGTYPGGKLLEWNGVDAWIEVAGRLGNEVVIRSLVVYNNNLYAGTGYGGRLYKWNGVDSWVEVAGRLADEIDIFSLVVFNNKIYGGTTLSSGKLLEWNGVDAWVEVAGKLGDESYIYSLVVFDNKIYAGTGHGGRLLEWNGVDAWVEVAGKLGDQTDILSLVVFNNKIYGGTAYDSGLLYEWNGVDAWVEVAGRLGDVTDIYSLVVFDNKIYGGVKYRFKLLEWQGGDFFGFSIPDLEGAVGATKTLEIPDTNKWYKVVIEIIGDNFARIEIQDELSNVILSSEGNFIPYSGAKNSVIISYYRYTPGEPFTVYMDDLKITQTARNC